MKKILLEAELNKEFLMLSFKDKKGTVKSSEMKVDNNLSRKLLPFLDRFLKKTGLDLRDVSKINLKSEMSDSFTSYRIVKITLDTAFWAANCG